jgi:hypothetical protein
VLKALARLLATRSFATRTYTSAPQFLASLPGGRAQQAGKTPIIGFLGADASAFSPWTDAFVARLRELGWIDGGAVAIGAEQG